MDTHAQGGPAQDMDQLKEAVSSAAAGTGEVQRVIRDSTFQPRAAAFTSLIQQCARARAWQKAVDVFHALQETPGLKVMTASHASLRRMAEGSPACKAWLVAEPRSKACFAAQTWSRCPLE